jgi:hypothetical protein
MATKETVTHEAKKRDGISFIFSPLQVLDEVKFCGVVCLQACVGIEEQHWMNSYL